MTANKGSATARRPNGLQFGKGGNRVLLAEGGGRKLKQPQTSVNKRVENKSGPPLPRGTCAEGSSALMPRDWIKAHQFIEHKISQALHPVFVNENGDLGVGSVWIHPNFF